MASIVRLGDSGGLGSTATRIVAAKTGSPSRVATVSGYGGGIRVSHWSFDAGNVLLSSTRTFEHVATQLDAAVIGLPVVAAYRDASTQRLQLASFNPGDVRVTGGGVIDDRRIALVRDGFSSRWFVAYSDDDELRVQYWQLTGNGDDDYVPALVASSGDQAGGATYIAGAWGAGSLVVAMRTGGDSLKLIRWGMVQGALERLGASGTEAGGVSDIAVTGFSGLDERARHFYVTAVRNASGNLEVINWRTAADGSVERVASATAGAVSEVAITSFDSPSPANLGVFVTAVKNGSGKLALISWRLHGDGSIHRLATAVAGAARQVAVLPASGEVVATSCIDGSGKEKVISWRIEQDPLLPP